MVVQEVIGWLHILPALAGLGLCAIYASRSRWAWLLVGAFALELLVSVSYRIGALLISLGRFEYSRVGMLFTIASMLGLVSSSAIVAGVAGLLFEAGSRLEPPA